MAERARGMPEWQPTRARLVRDRLIRRVAEVTRESYPDIWPAAKAARSGLLFPIWPHFYTAFASDNPCVCLSLKVALMSCYLEEALPAEASEREWHFLQKPFEMRQLASHLRSAPGGRIPETMRSESGSRSAASDDGSLPRQTPQRGNSDLAAMRPGVA